MAENIISPGVFTRENDLSFLPQGIGQIGAAVVGPTEKGPAFVPTVIRRGFAEYEARFGSYSKDTYVPLTVRLYKRTVAPEFKKRRNSYSCKNPRWWWMEIS